MRHLGSLVLSLILGALAYVLAGIGIVKYLDAQRDLLDDELSGYLPLTLAIGALVAAGCAYSLMILTRLSPLGPVLVSLALFGVAMWSMFDARGFGDTMPDELLGVDGALTAPAGPVALLLSVPLLLTLFSARRWRRYAYPMAAVAPAPGYSAPPETPSYAPSSPAAGYLSPDSAPPYPSSPGSYPGSSYPSTYSPPPAFPPYPNNDDPESTRRL